MHEKPHPRLLHPLDGVRQPGREIELGSDTQDAAAHGLPAAPEADVEQRPHREIAHGQRAHRRPARHVFALGIADDSDVALRFSHPGNGFGHERGDVLRQSVDAVARVKARELGGDRTLVPETGFKSHLPALPPARQIDDLRPAGRDDLFRDLVGNGTHRVLPVGFARGTPPSTREYSGARLARR